MAALCSTTPPLHYSITPFPHYFWLVAFRPFFSNLFRMPERVQKPPMPWGPKQGDGDGPKPPDISRPDTRDLLKKMRKVDPNQSKRYRQRTGQ